MGRQIYETESHIARERDVALCLEGAWHCKLCKLPVSYRVDYAIVEPDGRISGFVEIKCRNCASDKYDTLMISLGKVVAGQELSEISHVPFFIVVNYTDGTFAFKYIYNPDIRLAYGGRTVQTRDCADEEPVLFIPVKLFVEVPSSDEYDGTSILW